MEIRLPFKKGSPLNFLYRARIKRGMTQKKAGEKILRHEATWCEYENANSHIPEKIALEIPDALSFTTYERTKFKKFLEEAQRKIESKDRSIGRKNHISRSGWKRKDSASKRHAKNGGSKIKKHVNGLSSEDRKTLRFFKTFLKNGGKEDLALLSKFRKFVTRQ